MKTVSGKLSLYINASAIVLLCLISSLAGIADEKASPKIFADSYRFNFGEVEESVELKHIFKITKPRKRSFTIYRRPL